MAEPDAAARIALCERALAVTEGAPALLESVRARAGARQHTALRRAAASRRATRCARRWPTPTPPARCCWPSAPAASSSRPACARARRRSRAPRALTPRQRQVCELAAAGRGNRAIAQELFLSIKTVETHLAAGYRKLGVNTRAELAERLAS